MSDRSNDLCWSQREELHQWLQGEWRKALVEYRRHGAPFGSHSEGLAVWVEYGRITTAN